MDYEGQICRAPMERSSFMLPVMVGCSYNQCKFCNLFRHLKYRELPMEQIEAELKRVRELHGKPKKIFLGDGNAFGLKTEKLYEILDLIAYYFPECEGINMDATVTSILHKSQEELEMLARKKVKHLYLGIESGLDDVLKPMKESSPHLFKTVGGTKYNPAGGGNPPTVNPFAKDTFNLTEQGRMLRQYPEQAREMAAAAGVKI